MKKRELILILNRGEKLPDDGWYHVVPTGEFKVRVGGHSILQVIDDRAVAAMVERYRTAGTKLLVDFDHFSYDEGRKSEAAGWVVGVEARSDGLWAQIEWTDLGEPAILNKRYRFVSPVWSPADCEELGGNRLRPLRLDSIGLTNQPNMKGMQPLSNRGAGGKLPKSPEHKETQSMKKVLALLSLSPDASEDSAVDALQAVLNRASEADELKNRAETAEAKIETIEAAALETAADAFCDEHAAVIANRDTVKEQFIANRAATEALFAGIKVDADPIQPALKNRKAKQPDGTLKNRRDQQAAKISEIRNRTNCSHTEAFEQAAQENPALFTEQD